MAAIAHVIVGSTGVGKSTYARKLAKQERALRFAVDEWMDALYAADKPNPAGFDWYMPRVLRITEMIWQTALQALRNDTAVVLEIGLTMRDERERFYARAAADGVELKLHALAAAVETRWLRVDARNRERGETFSVEVTREMFDFVETMWEPPSDAELAAHGGQRVHTDEQA